VLAPAGPGVCDVGGDEGLAGALRWWDGRCVGDDGADGRVDDEADDEAGDGPDDGAELRGAGAPDEAVGAGTTPAPVPWPGEDVAQPAAHDTLSRASTIDDRRIARSYPNRGGQFAAMGATGAANLRP